MTCPAVRTVNRSPMPASKIISGLTRASEQLNTAASGSCVSITASRASTLRFGCSSLPSVNLWLPANMRLHTPFAVPSTSFWSTNVSSVIDSTSLSFHHRLWFIINGVSEVVSIESPSKAGAADVFLEIITQLFPGSDGIVPDLSNRATAPDSK